MHQESSQSLAACSWPYFQLAAAPSQCNQMAVEKVIWFQSMALHSGINLKRCFKVRSIIRHAGVDGCRVQLQQVDQQPQP